MLGFLLSQTLQHAAPDDQATLLTHRLDPFVVVLQYPFETRENVGHKRDVSTEGNLNTVVLSNNLLALSYLRTSGCHGDT